MISSQGRDAAISHVPCSLSAAVFVPGRTWWSRSPFMQHYLHLCLLNRDISAPRQQGELCHRERVFSLYYKRVLPVYNTHFNIALRCQNLPAPSLYHLPPSSSLFHLSLVVSHTWVSLSSCSCVSLPLSGVCPRGLLFLVELNTSSIAGKPHTFRDSN